MLRRAVRERERSRGSTEQTGDIQGIIIVKNGGRGQIKENGAANRANWCSKAEEDKDLLTSTAADD